MSRSVAFRKSELEEILPRAGNMAPRSKPETAGETVADCFTINLDGKDIVLITTATKTPKGGSCEAAIETSFEIDAGNDDVFPVGVGDLTCSIIDRTHMPDEKPNDGKSVKASRIADCLNALSDGEKSRLHSNDPKKAKQRTLRAVYDRHTGEPKSNPEILDVRQICYTPYLGINKGFQGGQGFPQWAMNGHRRAMKKQGFSGTHTLSPAPLEDGAAEKVRKISASYKKSGFRVLHAGDASGKGSMTMMAMAPNASGAGEAQQVIPKVTSHTRTLTNRGFPKPMTATPGAFSAESQQNAPGALLRGAAVGLKFGAPKPRAYDRRSVAERRKHKAIVAQQPLLPTTSIEPPNDLELRMEAREATTDYSHRNPSLATTTSTSTQIAGLDSSSPQATYLGLWTNAPVQPLPTVPEERGGEGE